MAYMAISIVCAFCGRYANFKYRWGIIEEERGRAQLASTCDFCQSMTMIKAEIRIAGSHPIYSVPATRQEMDTVLASAKSLEWWPKKGDAPTIENVPEHIRRAALEAYSSASVGNPMAAILMARTVIEATAKDNGIVSGVLAVKIDALRDKDLIRPAIALQAHEVRHAGNDMAHGDIDFEVDPADADEILALMSEVLQEVYQGPARLEALRAKRMAKSSHPNTPK